MVLPVHQSVSAMQFQPVCTTTIHQKGLKWSVCTVYCFTSLEFSGTTAVCVQIEYHFICTCLLDHLWTDYSKSLNWQPSRSTGEGSWIWQHQHQLARTYVQLENKTYLCSTKVVSRAMCEESNMCSSWIQYITAFMQMINAHVSIVG